MTVILVILAALIFKVQSQVCGCGIPGPFIQGPLSQINPGIPLPPGFPCNQPINPCQQSLLPPPINTPVCSQQPITSSCQPIASTTQPIITSHVVAATIIDNSVSNALANAIQLLIVSNLIENTMNCGHISPSIGPIIECITNDCNYEMEIPNICQYEPTGYQFHEACQTFAPAIYTAPCQTFAPCFADVGVVTQPVAAEVYFPSAIPAQLTCNFGYMPTNVPCVSVNVEPLPPMFDTSCNVFGNGFYF